MKGRKSHPKIALMNSLLFLVTKFQSSWKILWNHVESTLLKDNKLVGKGEYLSTEYCLPLVEACPQGRAPICTQISGYHAHSRAALNNLVNISRQYSRKNPRDSGLMWDTGHMQETPTIVYLNQVG